MDKKEKRQRVVTGVLLGVYLIAMTWIILFKMGFSISELDHFRGVNLIPFHESVIVNNKIDFSEIYLNVIIFVPFGVYLSMLKGNWSFIKKSSCIALTSLFYEVFQYIFAIGASDITDIIGNTLGGVIGIGIYSVISMMFKEQAKLNKVLNILASTATILVVGLLGVVVISNF